MLKITYNDIPRLSGVYAVIFKQHSSSGLLVNDGYYFDDINLYAPAVYLFAQHLTEITPGVYSTGIPPTNEFKFPEQLRVEIYRQSGYQEQGEQYGYDYFLGAGTVNYDGNNEAGPLQPSKLDNSPGFIGSLTIPQIGYIQTRLINEFGVPGHPDYQMMGYTVYNGSGQIITTGYLSSMGNGTSAWGAYYQRLIQSSLFEIGSYLVQMSGKRNGTPTYGYQTFDVKMPSVDMITALGYVTGFAIDLSPTSGSFRTSLQSNINNHYNGQVIRFTSGSLMGQPRIISAYVGSNKTVTLNKNLESAPSSGTPFVIFPIGGEYNVT